MVVIEEVGGREEGDVPEAGVGTSRQEAEGEVATTSRQPQPEEDGASGEDVFLDPGADYEVGTLKAFYQPFRKRSSTQACNIGHPLFAGGSVKCTGVEDARQRAVRIGGLGTGSGEHAVTCYGYKPAPLYSLASLLMAWICADCRRLTRAH
jgi:hypothetical protein